MNRRTWKDFLTKSSTIWTLSLCLIGAIVLGGMAAVNSSRNNSDTQSETELGQIAYLEEDLNEENEADNSILTDRDNATDTDNSTETGEEAASASSSRADDSADAGSSRTDGSSESTNIEGNSNTASSTKEDVMDTSDTTVSETTDFNNAEAANATDTSTTNNAEAANTTDISDTSNAETANTAGTSDTGDAVSTNTSGTSDTEEASSTSIIYEQALIEAGVSFTDSQSILWPCAGTVVIDYSMDKSVYFSSLNQYKYNPALVISSDSGNQVLASAKGIVESISINEETGTTLVLNIGNGYKLTYGQLKEPAVSEGDVVDAGDLLAYISEPTKYFSTEGSNLYFAMTKDGEPVDPVLYLE